MERNANLKDYSRQLRKEQTKEEALLWYNFLSKYPVRFRRQYIIGNYIVDFYCHKARLVVELDGSQHYNESEIIYDKQRTEYLESQGLKVLRFSNLDVLGQFRSVCESIDIACTNTLSRGRVGPHCANTLPRGEGGPRSGGRGTAAGPTPEKV